MRWKGALLQRTTEPDHEQVLPVIRSRFGNLLRQRKKGGGRKDAEEAFVAEGEEKSGGKRYSSSGANSRGKGRGCRGRGGRRDHRDDEEEE